VDTDSKPLCQHKSAFHDTTDTSMESAVASIACAKMFLQENDGGLEINTNIDIDIDRKALYIWNGAARNGRVEILEWMNKSEYSNCFDIKTGDLAAEHGHLEALMWFHKNGCPVDKATFAWAVWGGEVDDWE